MSILLLACIGLTWILKYGTILNKPRKYLCSLHPLIKDLFSCSLCLGFWSGVILSIYSPIPVLLPLASSAVSWFADCLIDYIQLQQIRAERELDLKK